MCALWSAEPVTVKALFEALVPVKDSVPPLLGGNVLGLPVTSPHEGHLVAVAGAPLIRAQGTVPPVRVPVNLMFPTTCRGSDGAVVPIPTFPEDKMVILSFAWLFRILRVDPSKEMSA